MAMTPEQTHNLFTLIGGAAATAVLVGGMWYVGKDIPGAKENICKLNPNAQTTGRYGVLTPYVTHEVRDGKIFVYNKVFKPEDDADSGLASLVWNYAEDESTNRLADALKVFEKGYHNMPKDKRPETFDKYLVQIGQPEFTRANRKKARIDLMVKVMQELTHAPDSKTGGVINTEKFYDKIGKPVIK